MAGIQKKLDGTLTPLCLKNNCALLSGHKGDCDATPSSPLTNLPYEIIKKLDKTAMTRGAQPYDRVPYENRVRRWNKAIIPFKFRDAKPTDGYDNGYIIMVRPEEYFDPNTRSRKNDFPNDIIVGENAFVYYDNRKDWNTYNPGNYNWTPRLTYLNGKVVRKRVNGVVDQGQYLARVPATTTAGPKGDSVVEGMPQGIRFFEYASKMETWKTLMQLAFLAWKSVDIDNSSGGKMPAQLEAVLANYDLADINKFESIGAIRNGVTCCPLCRQPINASDLMERVPQMAGREVIDLTVTKANLFHMDALMPGEFNHKIYKVSWGHYYCNTVARDMGVKQTLDWMKKVLEATGRIP